MKILIVNNNMKVGGVQKSLCNLLWELERKGEHEITLLLFNPAGEYMEMLPPNVKRLSVDSAFRYLGMSQGECRGADKLKRGALAMVARALGRSAALRLMLPGQKMTEENYDCAIAFLHNGGKKAFAGGVQEFVLERVRAKRKIAFIHGDYGRNGSHYRGNDRILASFDRVAVCSDGCGAALTEVLPELAEKTVTVRNCNHIAEIRAMAEENPVAYDPDRLHVLCVARLSATKGIDRAIRATEKALAEGLPVTLHIVGSGILEGQLKALAQELGIGEQVRFYGAQANPYRYMKHADLLLLTSHHEAAPMVIDEAYILGLPILTTKTSSSEEMVTVRGCGWVCENNQQDLDRVFREVLEGPIAGLRQKKEKMYQSDADNGKAMEQFAKVLKN